MNKGPNPKRMRGRGNGRGGRKHNPRQNVFDSNGPDVRIRGTAQQVLEKYLSLARETTANGDHISAEGYFQYAEHYYRVHQAMMDNMDGGRNRRRRDDQDDSGNPSDRANGSERDDDDEEPRYHQVGGGNGDGRERDDDSHYVAREERPSREERAPREERASREERPRRSEKGRSDGDAGDDTTPDGVEALRPNGQHALGEMPSRQRADRGGETSDESSEETAAS
ncbi:MAG: DUF4167 domain-containing protein [Acetobacterales bacterium]